MSERKAPYKTNEIDLRQELRYIRSLIDELVRDYPRCNCADIYRKRGLIDPNCIHCNGIDEMLYHNLVGWRDRMTRVEVQGKIVGPTRP